MADRDRINSYLQNIAEGESAFDDPRTEEEVFLANIANGDENTRNANTREEYWLKQIEAGGGGGNPNYVETIEGTLANPWGEHSFADLAAEYDAGNLTYYFEFPDRQGWDNVKLYPKGNGAGYRRVFSNIILLSGGADEQTVFSGAMITYTGAGALRTGNVSLFVNGGVGLAVTGEEITRLTIIHHPLPSA